MKTLNIFLNTIYCAEVVQSCITFQHNLPHAQCKSSSAYKVHTYRPFCTLFVACLPTYRIMARNFDFLLQI